MKTSDKGIDLIKRHEGLRTNSYLCPAGVVTIGYGHTKGVLADQRCTLEQADKWLREDVSEAEKAVNKLKGLNQNQFDALVSLVFNCGTSPILPDKTIGRLVRLNPNDPKIRDGFNLWVKSKGQTLTGLVRRRKDEADLYFS